jgi:hypothetical protein
VFFLFFFLFSKVFASDPPPPEALSNHAYAILSADSIDMGRLQAGNPGVGSITLTNAGNREMIVARVRSSCGLLITSWPAKPLSPGEQASISFRYDTSTLGAFRRNIVIHTNAWQGTLVVPVKGEVVPARPKASD